MKKENVEDLFHEKQNAMGQDMYGSPKPADLVEGDEVEIIDGPHNGTQCTIRKISRVMGGWEAELSGENNNISYYCQLSSLQKMGITNK
jgi:transcription antitermination factor NusG